MMRDLRVRELGINEEFNLDKLGASQLNAGMRYWLIPIAETIPEKFANVFLILREAVAERVWPGPPPLLDLKLAERIVARLQRIKKRIDSLLARIKAGTLRPPQPYQPRGPSKPRERPPRPRDQPSAEPAGPRLPTDRNWLRRLVPGRESEASAVGWASHILAQMLQTQELAFLIGKYPSLGEELRPLCRMVGVDPTLLPPPPPRPPRPARPKRSPPPAPKPPQRDGAIGPGSLLWSGAKPLAKGFRIRDWDVPRSKDKEAKFLRRVRI